MELCSREPLLAAGRVVEPETIILADLLHGPEIRVELVPRTALERITGPASTDVATIDDVLSKWLTAYVSPPTWPVARPGESFVSMARRLAATDGCLGRSLHPRARTWFRCLDDDPARIIDAAFAATQIADENRVAEMRGHLASVAGWSGLAKWRTEWAQPDETRPTVSPIDIVAVRAMLESAVAMSRSAEFRDARPAFDDDTARIDTAHIDDARHLAARVDTVMQQLELPDTSPIRPTVHRLLEAIPDAERAAAWLAASEVHLDQHLLAMLDRLEAKRPAERAEAQLVFCIDVRSEGLRRHLEAAGHDETIGFAGFFGVPMRFRRLGWDRAEARCPVLVSPGVDATEIPDPDAVADLAQHFADRRRPPVSRSRTARPSTSSGPRSSPPKPRAGSSDRSPPRKTFLARPAAGSAPRPPSSSTTLCSSSSGCSSPSPYSTRWG